MVRQWQTLFYEQHYSATVLNDAVDFVKLAEAEASVIAFYRMLFTVLLMMPLFLVKYRTELHTLSQRDWFFSAIAGIFLAFHFIL